jgi:hypothetical protein
MSRLVVLRTGFTNSLTVVARSGVPPVITWFIRQGCDPA